MLNTWNNFLDIKYYKNPGEKGGANNLNFCLEKAIMLLVTLFRVFWIKNF
jgi:hypothetical protein